MVAKQFAPGLLLPPTVRVGEALNIRYSSFTGLVPVVKVATHESTVVVSYLPMVERSDQPGLYEYIIPKIEGSVFTVDKPMMITVSEPVTSNFEAGSVQVVSASLDTVVGMVAASMGIKDKVQDTYDAVQSMTGSFGKRWVTSSVSFCPSKEPITARPLSAPKSNAAYFFVRAMASPPPRRLQRGTKLRVLHLRKPAGNATASNWKGNRT